MLFIQNVNMPETTGTGMILTPSADDKRQVDNMYYMLSILPVLTFLTGFAFALIESREVDSSKFCKALNRGSITITVTTFTAK